MTKPINKLINLGALALFLGIGAAAVLAEEARPAVAQGSVQPQGIQERIARWKQLKEEDPEAFARLVQERKGKIRERLQELKTRDPEKFQEFKHKIRHQRFSHLRRMEQQNPERFQEFLKNHPRLADRWEHRRENREGRRDRLEDRRDRREDHWDRREDFRDAREDFRDRREDFRGRRGDRPHPRLLARRER